MLKLEEGDTCDVGFGSQGERAHNGRVEDEVRRVLSHSAQQAADALSNVRLWMVETGEELRDDAWGEEGKKELYWYPQKGNLQQ